ncbi:MAG: tetratricopeptide repeat protein [Actinomycetota bacterium]|nr:tetratricopeptide repeat protein [Actinomycetota bacterium]
METRAEELLDQSPPESHPLSLVAAIRVSTDRLAHVDPAALALVRIGAFLAPEPIRTDVLTHPIAATGCDRPRELEALTAAIASPVAAHRSLGRIGSYGPWPAPTAGCTGSLKPSCATSSPPTPPLLIAPMRRRSWSRQILATSGIRRAGRPGHGSCRAAWYLRDRGEDHPARDFAEHLYGQWREHLGPDDLHTLRAAYTLVRLYAAHWFACCVHEVGAFGQSRQLNVDTLARRRRVLGEDHLDVQRTVHNLARDLRELGEVEAARQLHEDTLAYRRRLLGHDHPLTINTANELGFDLYALGQVDAARRLHEDSLTRARRVLGEDPYLTMDSANGLASDLHALGEAEAARQLGEDTLIRARRVLGDESHFTMDTANILATAFLAVGEVEAARQLSEDTLARARRVFGDNHPRTRKAADNLAAARRLLRESAHQGGSDPVGKS